MLAYIKKMFAVILAFFQMLFLNVSYGEYVEPQETPDTPTQIINDIDGDTQLDNSNSSWRYSDGRRTTY